MYVYQGEELGLPEVEDIPSDRRQDPMWLRSGGVDPGRDGCRVPLPWSESEQPYGFSQNGASRPWLDQPDDWAPLTVESQEHDPASMLSLYRAGLRIRHTAPWGDDASLRWQPSEDTVLAFARGERFACIVNFGPQPVALPAGADVLIASDHLEGGELPQDTSVWLLQAERQAPFAADRLERNSTSDEVNEREGP
jgi:alpha-glucosidase